MKNTFCPRCKSILIPKKVGENKLVVKCSRCGFFKEIKGEGLIRTDKIKRKEVGEGIVKDGNELADYDNVCKKCGYNKAQIIDMGIFYSDEDQLILLKCGRCGYSERVGEKVS